MVKHLYSDDDRAKKSKITAFRTAFPLETLSVKQEPKYSASKGKYCRHSVILEFSKCICLIKNITINE